MELRDYQQAALQAIHARYDAGVRRQLLSAATGAGKTEIFSFLIQEQIAVGRNCLVLAHRDRLVTQAAARIEGIVGAGKVGIVNGERKDWWHQAVVATVQSAAGERQLKRAPKFSTVIIDECHRAGARSYAKVIEALLAPDGLLLGVTATPNRTDKKGLIPDIFDELVFEIRMQQLIDEGYLCPVVGKEIKLPIDFSQIKTAVGMDGIRDYRPEEVQSAFEEAKWLERITEGWRLVASDRRTIIFVPPGVVDGRGCGMAHSLAEYMRLQGIAAAAVDGNTAKREQDRVIEDFTAGQIQVLVNVNIFTEGLDIPPIDCVLFARPTQSSIIYSQAIGRGTRLFSGKENLLVVDVTGITEELAKEGQSLMTLGKVLPTEEQREDQRKARRQAARDLIRKLWRKKITLAVEDGRIVIVGEIGPRDRAQLEEYQEEIAEILAERDGESIAAGSGERKPINGHLLTSDQIEIRDIDFTRAGMRFDWVINRENKEAYISNGDRFHVIRRRADDLAYQIFFNQKYLIDSRYFATPSDQKCETWDDAKAVVERRIAKLEIQKQHVFNDPNAKWRSAPASEKQREMLRKFKVPYGPDLTKGEATDIISRFLRRKRA